MRKLLHAGFRRYTHSVLFWIGIAVSIIIGVYSGKEAVRRTYFEDSYYQYLLLAYAAIISLLIGREFSDGIFRNKITCGHSKGRIFISEAILAIGTFMGMFILCSACYIPYKLSILNIVPVNLIVQMYTAIFIVTLTFVCIAILISCCISSKATASIVSILLVIALIAVGTGVSQWLGQIEYNTYIGDPNNPETTTYQVKNPSYVDKPFRYVLLVAEPIMPYSLLYHSRLILWDMYVESDIQQRQFDSFGHYTKPVYVIDGNEQQHYKKVQSLSVSLTIFAIALLAVGYLVFRKKDFK